MNQDFVFDGGELEIDNGRPATQSPWEFGGYSAAVKDEHASRRTTSLDHKISELKSRKERRAEAIRQQDEIRDKARALKRRKPVASDDEEEDEEEEEEDEAEGHGIVADEQEVESDEEEGDDTGEVEDALDGVVAKDPEANGEHAGARTGEEEDDDSDDEPQEFRQTVVIEEGPGENGKDEKKSPSSFFGSSEGASFTAKSFRELNISRPLVRACDALGYEQPTPIQAACIPLGLTGRDICGSAVTGSGKTAAFGLPLLERLLYRPRRIPAIRVLILTPTRELAVQVHSMLEKLAQFTDIRCCLVVGGLSSKVQEASLRSQPDIVVATPGRMIDHLHNAQSVGLEELAILVLDEADRLLELGFTNEVHELVRMCPRRRQTMLFSATMTEQVDELVKLSLNKPVRLSADPKTQRPSTLTEEIVKIRPFMEADREAVLLALCTRSFKSKVIIFSGTKVEAHRLKIMFGLLGMKAAELHGNLTQAMRLDALEIFRKQEADFLLATDVAARGLDIVGVETVINYECPTNITTYVHRVGRTARAGQQGCAVTFLAEKDRALLKAVGKRGGQLQNRIVAKAAIEKFRQKIEEMEDDIKTIMQEERDERMLRKAEMEANKAQNMMDHEDEIYSRPKRMWFQTEKEKKVATKAATEAKFGKDTRNLKKFVNLEEAEEIKKKEKRQREREKNLPRKKRRRLEAQREEAEDDDEDDEDDENDDEPRAKIKTSMPKSKGVKDGKGGRSLVDVAYQRAKAVKGEERAREAGKLPPKRKEFDKKKKPAPNRKDEMEDLFQGDMNAGKRKKPGFGGGKQTRKPGVSKHAFKSKARYKRRK